MRQNNIVVEMKQHAVGQGGFFKGSISSQKGTYRWVYDCGSDDENRLMEEIRAIQKDQIIDTLYLSHLHRDHTNGVEALMKQCNVKQVVLPYLNEYEKIITLLDYTKRNIEVSDFVRELILSPSEWQRRFAENVDRVILVRQGGIEDLEPVDENPLRSLDGFTEAWDSVFVAPPSTPRSSSSSGKAYVASGKSIITVDVEGFDFGWEFVPHCHSVSDEQYRKFRLEVNRTFNKGMSEELNNEDVKNIVKCQSKLNNLMGCYDKIWRDNNLISMSLYIGPTAVSAEAFLAKIENCNKIYRGYNGFTWHGRFYDICCDEDEVMAKNLTYGGWMLTGDSNFYRRIRLNEFVNRYRKYKSIVDVVMVPHHGSHYNVIQEFFDFFDNLSLTYAAAGPTNKHRHPSPKVVCMACTVAPFHVVGTDPSSELTLRSEWRFW